MRTTSPLRVLYYQLTLGPAHMARIKALDMMPGISCRGVQLASLEHTRQYELDDDDLQYVDTVVDGMYEEIPLTVRIRRSCAHLGHAVPDAIIVDSPADPVQWILGYYARRIGALAMIRWAATANDHPRYLWKEYLKRFVYRGWDRYLVTGERSLDYLRTFGEFGSRATICGNPVDSQPIEAARGRSNYPRELSFLFVGRFLSLKNLDALIRAFLQYRSKGGRWTLKIVGTGKEKDVNRLHSAARSIPSIRFLSHLQFNDLIDVYLKAGCLVLPSYSENWGLVVNEAMHAGMPLIISDRCGCFPDLLQDGINGFAFDPFDESSICSALVRMENATVEERASFSRSSVEIIRDHTPENWARRVADSVMEGRGTS